MPCNDLVLSRARSEDLAWPAQALVKAGEAAKARAKEHEKEVACLKNALEAHARMLGLPAG